MITTAFPRRSPARAITRIRTGAPISVTFDPAAPATSFMRHSRIVDT